MLDSGFPNLGPVRALITAVVIVGYVLTGHREWGRTGHGSRSSGTIGGAAPALMPKPSTRERSGFCVLLPNTFPELQSVRKG